MSGYCRHCKRSRECLLLLEIGSKTSILQVEAGSASNRMLCPVLSSPARILAFTNFRMLSQTNLAANDPNSRPTWVRREALILAPYAMFSKQSAGRKHTEALHPYRSPFQRDRDRILHSAAFRRLSGKMQVFTGDMGDFHRTRLTHTHEVATIARTLGRALQLNEDLIEALALLHDIGHPPYGHSGEDALRDCLQDQGGFSHNRFAITLAEELELRYTAYPGMNLTHEVLAGQDYRINHSELAPLLEVQIVDLADSIAYNAHDIDDALALGLLDFRQLNSLELVGRARELARIHQRTSSELAERQSLVHSLIDVQVADVLEVAQQKLTTVPDLDQLSIRQLEIQLGSSTIIESERQQLSQFLFENVYRHPQLMRVRSQAAQRVQRLFESLVAKPETLPRRFQNRAQQIGIERAVGDYLAGMTDRFCDLCYHKVVEFGVNEASDW